MKGVNKAVLIGRLGHDPSLRTTAGGTSVVNFSLAVSERAKRDGEWVDVTEWFNIVLFGKMAENAKEHLAKGSTVYIEGRIQTRKWKDKDGNDRTTTEIIANDVTFLGGKSKPAASEEDPFQDDGFDPNEDAPF